MTPAIVDDSVSAPSIPTTSILTRRGPALTFRCSYSLYVFDEPVGVEPEGSFLVCLDPSIWGGGLCEKKFNSISCLGEEIGTARFQNGEPATLLHVFFWNEWEEFPVHQIDVPVPVGWDRRLYVGVLYMMSMNNKSVVVSPEYFKGQAVYKRWKSKMAPYQVQLVNNKEQQPSSSQLQRVYSIVMAPFFY